MCFDWVITNFSLVFRVRFHLEIDIWWSHIVYNEPGPAWCPAACPCWWPAAAPAPGHWSTHPPGAAAQSPGLTRGNQRSSCDSQDSLTCGEVHYVGQRLVGLFGDLNLEHHLPLLPPGGDGLLHLTLLYLYYKDIAFYCETLEKFNYDHTWTKAQWYESQKIYEYDSYFHDGQVKNRDSTNEKVIMNKYII